jgi:hypothetical protein
VAELVDAHDSNSCIARCEGSIPSFGTKALILDRGFFYCTFLNIIVGTKSKLGLFELALRKAKFIFGYPEIDYGSFLSE